MVDWHEHHAGFGRDYGRLRRATRLTYDVAANWKIVAENYSECYHCPGVHPLLNQLTPYDLGEDFFPAGPWKGGWMVFSEGCETMSMDGLRHGRPLLHATDEVDERRIYYYILWPNLIVSVHPDYVLTHQAWPAGPNRTIVNCDLYVDADSAGRPDLDISGARRLLGPDQPAGLPRGRAPAGRHALVELGGRSLLEPGGQRPGVRPDGRRPLRQRRRPLGSSGTTEVSRPGNRAARAGARPPIHSDPIPTAG